MNGAVLLLWLLCLTACVPLLLLLLLLQDSPSSDEAADESQGQDVTPDKAAGTGTDP
jgi:hypothetical protein